MARKKHAPLFANDNVCEKAVMLLQSIDILLRHGTLSPAVKEILIERCAELRAALGDMD